MTNPCPICVRDHETDPEYPIRAATVGVRLDDGWWHVCHDCAGRVAERLEELGRIPIVLGAPSARLAYDEALPYAGEAGALAIARGVQDAVRGALLASLRRFPRPARRTARVAHRPAGAAALQV